MNNIDKLVRTTLQEVGSVTPPPLLDEYFESVGIKSRQFYVIMKSSGQLAQGKGCDCAELDNINRYPETGSTVLRTAIAEYYGLEPDQCDYLKRR